MPDSVGPLQLLIAQTHDAAIARASLQQLLESQPGITVVTAVGTSNAALQAVKERSPDVVLLDAFRCDESVDALLRSMLEINSACRAIVLTDSENPEAHQRAIHSGALGIVLQKECPATLFKAIACVHRGEIWIDRTLAATVLRERNRSTDTVPDSPRARIAALTDSEREVIVLTCQGLKNQAVGEQLFLSEATVRHRLTAIFEKLKVANRLELIVFAYQHGVVTFSG